MYANKVAREAMTVTVANAPISWGAFELTVGIHPGYLTPTGILDLGGRGGYTDDLGRSGFAAARSTRASPSVAWSLATSSSVLRPRRREDGWDDLSTRSTRGAATDRCLATRSPRGLHRRVVGRKIER
jgi:hypothetical protein